MLYCIYLIWYSTQRIWKRRYVKIKKMAWCVHGRHLFFLPLNNRLFFVPVNHFLYPFCFSPNIIINTLATYTLEAHGVFSVFIILLQNPSPGSRSWNVTLFFRNKIIKEESPHGNLRVIAMIHEFWGLAGKNREQGWDFNKDASSFILS